MVGDSFRVSICPFVTTSPAAANGPIRKVEEECTLHTIRSVYPPHGQMASCKWLLFPKRNAT